MLSSGALVIHSAGALSARLVRSPAGAAERAHGAPGWVSTLLGPEGAAADAVGFFKRPGRTASRTGGLVRCGSVRILRTA